MKEGRGSPHGGVFLDISYLPAERVRRKLPSMYEQFKELADVDITAGEVIVQEVICAEVADDGACARFFPSDEQIDPADQILEADGVVLESVEDLIGTAQHGTGECIFLVEFRYHDPV